MFLGVGVVYAILSVCLTVDHGTQSRIRMTRVNQYDVGTLLIVLAHDVVHEETLSAARRPKYELVSVGGDTLLHRQITNVNVQWLSRQPVHHFYSKWRERRPVVGLFGKQAHCWLDERIKRLFGREVALVAGDARPVERRAIDGVVPWHTLHTGQLASDVVLGVLQFFSVITPCNHVVVRTDADESLRVRFVQVHVYPLLVDGVAAAVAAQRLHISSRLLKALQVVVAVVDNHILVVDVVAG